MKSEKFKYNSVLRFGTLQFDGHVHDYFIKNANKLVEFYVLSRNGAEKNFITYYKNGKLIEKKEVYSPKNIFLAYLMYYYQYVYILFNYFSRKEKFYTINSLPIFLFFNSFWQFFRNFEVVYWIQDYWPMDGKIIRIFRLVMHYYHKRAKYTIYVSDRINNVMNGRIVDTSHKHTVMLGTDMPNTRQYSKAKPIKLVFIGVLKAAQGIDELLAAIAMSPKIQLRLIGTGDKVIVSDIKKLIARLKITHQVFFPNKFLYKNELTNIVADCHIGVVLYEETNNSVTYYADPAKIKQYAEFGLPIITTATPEISLLIKKFKAGEIVLQDKNELLKAILKIQNNYGIYSQGIKEFCNHFSYQEYFSSKFKFLETERMS